MSGQNTDTVDGTPGKRPWLAALLAFVYPGLGHVYLREWARALLWFGLVLLTASLLVPAASTPAEFSIQGLLEMTRGLPLEAVLAITAVTGLSMADAYRLASQANERQRRVAEGTRCPNCDREVDPDLAFCHWCTTELDESGGNERVNEV